MGGTELLIAGLTIAGAAVSAKQAQDQNRALSRSAGSAERGQRIQSKQIREAAVLEQRKIESQAARVRGLIRVSGAARGVGISGSVESQLLQADFDERLGIDAINANQASALEFARSRLEAIGIDLSGREMNSILAGFSGGLQGLSTGLSIANTIPSESSTTIPKTPKSLRPLAREFRVIT